MKLSHKLLYCIGVLIFSSSIGIFSYAYAVEPETQTIIDSANQLDSKLQAAIAPKEFCAGNESSATATINGTAISALPCDDPSLVGKMCPSTTYCYFITY